MEFDEVGVVAVGEFGDEDAVGEVAGDVAFGFGEFEGVDLVRLPSRILLLFLFL